MSRGSEEAIGPGGCPQEDWHPALFTLYRLRPVPHQGTRAPCGNGVGTPSLTPGPLQGTPGSQVGLRDRDPVSLDLSSPRCLGQWGSLWCPQAATHQPQGHCCPCGGLSAPGAPGAAGPVCSPQCHACPGRVDAALQVAGPRLVGVCSPAVAPVCRAFPYFLPLSFTCEHIATWPSHLGLCPRGGELTKGLPQSETLSPRGACHSPTYRGWECPSLLSSPWPDAWSVTRP